MFGAGRAKNELKAENGVTNFFAQGHTGVAICTRTPVWLSGEGQTGWVLKRGQPVCMGMGNVSQLASLGSTVWDRQSGAG